MLIGNEQIRKAEMCLVDNGVDVKENEKNDEKECSR